MCSVGRTMIPVRQQQVMLELCCPPPTPAPTAPLPPLLFLLSKASCYVTLALITILPFFSCPSSLSPFTSHAGVVIMLQ